jgi:hypothetical protein
LVDYWLGRLGKAERLILEALTEAYPRAIAKEEIAAKGGYEANGGGFNNALDRVRTPELVQGRGDLLANENLVDRLIDRTNCYPGSIDPGTKQVHRKSNTIF